MMITAVELEEHGEIRLYKDNGDYWPIKAICIDKDYALVLKFIEFINGTKDGRNAKTSE